MIIIAHAIIFLKHQTNCEMYVCTMYVCIMYGQEINIVFQRDLTAASMEKKLLAPSYII